MENVIIHKGGEKYPSLYSHFNGKMGIKIFLMIGDSS